MSLSSQQIVSLRKERGWSQEKLAAISGVSERTIQRIERDGSCSLETRMALASAFDLSPSELSGPDADEQNSSEMRTDWSGAFGLFILGLAIPAVILLTGTNGKWEMASFFTVIGLTVVMSIMTYGLKATHTLLDRTSWLVRYPVRASGLGSLIVQAQSLIANAYTIGVVASLVTGLALAVHKPDLFDQYRTVIPIIIKPLLYAALFVEFWFRPYKRKLERMLQSQTESST